LSDCRALTRVVMLAAFTRVVFTGCNDDKYNYYYYYYYYYYKNAPTLKRYSSKL